MQKGVALPEPVGRTFMQALFLIAQDGLIHAVTDQRVAEQKVAAECADQTSFDQISSLIDIDPGYGHRRVNPEALPDHSGCVQHIAVVR